MAHESCVQHTLLDQGDPVPQSHGRYLFSFKKSDIVEHKPHGSLMRSKLAKIWNGVSELEDTALGNPIRDYRNCVSNYVVHQSFIPTKWIKGTSISKIVDEGCCRFAANVNKQYGSSTVISGNQNSDAEQTRNVQQWMFEDLQDYIDVPLPGGNTNEYHRLSTLNLKESLISIVCPHCKILLQCITTRATDKDGYDRVGMVCYNYPRCTFPLDSADYRNKYVWNKVVYIGPDLFHQDKSSEFDYEEIWLAAFGGCKKTYGRWQFRRRKVITKLTKHMKWKSVCREKRMKEMSQSI